ncbi:MAG: glycosyltransferase family 4 protein [Gemmatimonadaceae bacterium]
MIQTNLYPLLCTSVAFVLSLWLTGWFRSYALRAGLLDVPNARSSHVGPTPRGGGVAIVVAVQAMLPALAIVGEVEWRTVLGLMTSGLIAAAIGYADDRAQVGLPVRLGAQFAAAACIVGFLGFAPVISVFGLSASFAWIAAVFTLLYLVWMLNLTNFMDGIDGLASAETISISVGTVVCVVAVAVKGTDNSVAAAVSIATLLAAATAGFLYWNWAPAKIFMGDAGSGFVGISLGALALVAGYVDSTLLWSSVILAGVFIVDATVTLFRRIARREKFYNAHRSHAYQHAAQRWGHTRVTTAVIMINVFWLLPWAVAAAQGSLYGAVACVLAYSPLVAAALRFRAGVAD